MLKFITKEKITKSVCNSTSTLSRLQDHRCDVRLRLYGMISLPSASAMDVKLQSPVPQLTSGERQARREGGPGKGRRMGSFPGRKLAGCFSQNEICDRAPRECFPHPVPPPVALDGATGPGSR